MTWEGVGTAMLSEEVIFSRLSADKDKVEEVMALWKSTIRKSAALVFPLVAFFILFATDLVIFLFSRDYENSAVYFRIAMVRNFFNIIMFAPLMFAIGKTKAYARVHMILAFLVWGLDYLIILVFNSPVALALNSAILAIIKVIVFVVYLARYFRIPVHGFIPFPYIFRLLVQSFLGVVLSKYLTTWLMPEADRIVVIMAGFAVFLLFIAGTSRLFRLEYLSVLAPMLNRFRIFQKIAHIRK